MNAKRARPQAARLAVLVILMATVSGAAGQAGDSPSGQDPVRAFLKPGARAAVPLDDILRGGPAVDGRLHPKETVFGVSLGQAALAVPVQLVREKGPMRASLAGHEIVFKYEDGVRAHGKGGEIPGMMAYWFAWSAFHPQTELVLASP